MKDPNVQKEWAEQKIEEYVDSSVEDRNFSRHFLKAHMNILFPRLLASHNNSLVERLEGKKMRPLVCAIHDDLHFCKWKISGASNSGCKCECPCGYNQALTQAQELIKNSLEK